MSAKSKSTNLGNPDDLDSTKNYINGPVNVVRMEGKIGDIRKVAYLFFDFHLDLYRETECTNVYSQDVNKYFADSFKNMNHGNKKYDFFLETRPSDIQSYKSINNFGTTQYKTIYLDELRRLLSKIINYDESADKVKLSDKIKNVRMHYIDIRDFIGFNPFIIFGETENLAYQMIQSGPNPRTVDIIIEIITTGKKDIENIIQLVLNPEKKIPEKKQVIRKNALENRMYNVDPDIAIRLSNKIRARYNHPDVQKPMNDILKNVMENKLDKLLEKIDTSIKKFTHYNEIFKMDSSLLYNKQLGKYKYGIPFTDKIIMVTEIYVDCSNLVDDVIDFFVDIMDIYFLRRFLDKDYITNGIIYTGAAHSINYVKFLVKYFDFKITHAAYNLAPDIDILNKEVRSSIEKNEPFEDLLWPPRLSQCSDLSNFPENFE